ncbi:MAG TPA: Gfo/Idh/MocA family oxidoreductase [Tepidisphaeraceae bacterium]|jgi:predicted dehydrogenase
MTDVTRRSFLEHTLTVAAAGLALTASGRRTHASEPSPSAATRPGPNDRVGIAIVGLHGRGLDHLDAYTFDDRVDIVALCDADEATFAKAQRKLSERGRRAARQYGDVRKLLEDKDVHAVSIATPSHWHALAAIWAMQAGKDAYVEKPVSHNITEGRRLEQARIKYGRVCQAGTQSRSNAAYRQAIQYVHDGHIGKVLLARGLCYKRRKSIGHFDDAPVPAGVDYDLWLGPAPKRPFNPNRFHYNWHWNWDYGNGDIGNQGVHQMDVARWAIRKELPPSVVAFGGRFGYDDDGRTPNTVTAHFEYGDAQTLFEVRGLETPTVMDLAVGTIIYGTDGFVAIANEDTGSAVAFDASGGLVKRFKGSGNHFNNFASAVLARRQADLHCPILEGHFSSAMCHMANLSYRLGEPQSFAPGGRPLGDNMDLREAFGRFEQHLADNMLKLRETRYSRGPVLAFDAKSERFASDDRANAMITRDYRAPFAVPEHV